MLQYPGPIKHLVLKDVDEIFQCKLRRHPNLPIIPTPHMNGMATGASVKYQRAGLKSPNQPSKEEGQLLNHVSLPLSSTEKYGILGEFDNPSEAQLVCNASNPLQDLIRPIIT